MSRFRPYMSPNAIARKDVVKSKCELRLHGFSDYPYGDDGITPDITTWWAGCVYDMYVHIIKNTIVTDTKQKYEDCDYVSFDMDYTLQYNIIKSESHQTTSYKTFADKSMSLPYITPLDFEELKQNALYTFARKTALEIIDSGRLVVYHYIMMGKTDLYSELCIEPKYLLTSIKDIHAIGECVADVWHDSIVE